MVKRIIIGAAVLVGLGVVVAGWDTATSYLAGTRQVISDEIDDRTPLSLEKARIEALIRKEQDSVLAFEDRVADLEARRDGMARALEEISGGRAVQMGLLGQIKELLDEQREQYTIGRATYTYAEVNADALERLREVERMQEEIDFQESLLADLNGAIRQGRSSLHESHRRLQELRGAVDRLEQRNVNAEIRLQVAQLANTVSGAQLTVDSELERAVRNYERRVGAKERRAASRLSAGTGPYRIDYTSAMVTQDAAGEIRRLLGGEGEYAGSDALHISGEGVGASGQ